MKYFISILAIAITASVAGFVVWHLMWMKEIEKKFRTEQSSGAASKIEAKVKKNENRREKTYETMPVAEIGAASVQESRTQINQAEKPRKEMENSGDDKGGTGTGLIGSENTHELEKGTGKWFEKDISLGRKNLPGKPDSGKSVNNISNDKTIPGMIKNKANPVIDKSISQPQPVKGPDVRITGVTRFPTSTPPQ